MARLLTLQASISPVENDTNVIIASTQNSDAIIIEDLQAIINLSSIGVSDFSGKLSKVLQLSLRDTGSNVTTNLLRIPIYNKRVPYSENLLSYLTSKAQFLLGTNKELRLSMMAGSSLSGNDLISVIGQASVSDTVSSSQISQTFVTANYGSTIGNSAIITPELFDNWQNVGGNKPRYYKDASGRVHLTGTLQRIDGIVNQATPFTFDTGFKPKSADQFVVSMGLGGYAIITVLPNRLDILTSGIETIYLSGISFLAA